MFTLSVYTTMQLHGVGWVGGWGGGGGGGGGGGVKASLVPRPERWGLGTWLVKVICGSQQYACGDEGE